jgi:stage II sporulation protein AA (anti-sigma F factor antagonist)
LVLMVLVERGELWCHRTVPDEMLWFEMTNGVLHVFGEVDMLSSPLLFAAVTERAESGVVVVDLTGVTFIDSSGLHALTRLRSSLPGMRVADASPSVLRILEITGLVELLLEERDHGCGGSPAKQ